MTATVEQTIEVQVPIETAYNEWSSSRGSRASWRGPSKSGNWMIAGFTGSAELGGERHEWDAEIVEQHAEERAAWRNTDGKDNAGVVTKDR